MVVTITFEKVIKSFLLKGWNFVDNCFIIMVKMSKYQSIHLTLSFLSQKNYSYNNEYDKHYYYGDNNSSNIWRGCKRSRGPYGLGGNPSCEIKYKYFHLIKGRIYNQILTCLHIQLLITPTSRKSAGSNCLCGEHKKKLSNIIYCATV